MTRFAIVEAPFVLGLHPTGVERLPDALLGAGLADRLSARHAALVKSPPHDALRDQATMLMNPRAIASYSVALADAGGRDEDATDCCSSMDLALATGRGPDVVANIEGRRPLVRDGMGRTTLWRKMKAYGMAKGAEEPG